MGQIIGWKQNGKTNRLAVAREATEQATAVRAVHNNASSSSSGQRRPRSLESRLRFRILTEKKGAKHGDSFNNQG